jgi:hypothetical protein
VRHRGENEWHERPLTFRFDKDDRAVLLTPDEDHYVVEPRSEFDAVYPLGARGVLPSYVRKTGQLVYCFRNKYTDAELAKILDEGRGIAADERFFPRPRSGGAPAALEDEPRRPRGAASPGRDDRLLRGQTPSPPGSEDDEPAGAKLEYRTKGPPPALPLTGRRGAPGSSTDRWLLAERTETEDIGADVTSLLIVGSAVDGVALCTYTGEVLRAERVAADEVEGGGSGLPAGAPVWSRLVLSRTSRADRTPVSWIRPWTSLGAVS